MELRFEPVPLPQEQQNGNRKEVTHLLTLPRFIDPGDIEFLVQCIYPRAHWTTEPEEELHQGKTVTLTPGALRVGSHSTLRGPYLLDEQHPAGGGQPAAIAYALTTLWERGDEALEGEGDRDGIIRIFNPLLPIRQELRGVHLLIALARRIDGAAIFAVTPPELGRNGLTLFGPHNYARLDPNPDVNVDLTIYSDVWLEPQAALAVAHGIAPTAVFAGQGEEWAGPPQEVPEVLAEARENLEPGVLEHIHEVASENDLDALAGGEVASMYAIFIPDHEGIISIEIGGSEYVPAALEGIDWISDGVLEYRISWVPNDQEMQHTEFPDAAFAALQHERRAIVAELARQFYHQTGGEVADQDGFLVDPAEL